MPDIIAKSDTITHKLASINEPVMKADWCVCRNCDATIKLLEKSHLCWCRCMDCGRESVPVLDNAAQAVCNWCDGKIRPLSGPTVLQEYF